LKKYIKTINGNVSEDIMSIPTMVTAEVAIAA